MIDLEKMMIDLEKNDERFKENDERREIEIKVHFLSEIK